MLAQHVEDLAAGHIKALEKLQGAEPVGCVPVNLGCARRGVACHSAMRRACDGCVLTAARRDFRSCSTGNGYSVLEML